MELGAGLRVHFPQVGARSSFEQRRRGLIYKMYLLFALLTRLNTNNCRKKGSKLHRACNTLQWLLHSKDLIPRLSVPPTIVTGSL